jgi:23S rRNA (guanosine2251-2'-O)-methyltransferase
VSKPPHAIPGRRAVEEALRAGRQVEELLVEDGADLAAMVARAKAAGIPVSSVDRDRLHAAAGGVAHQGVVARAPAFGYVDLTEISGSLVVVLDGVTDPQNLGAIARSAEAAGADALVLPKKRSAHVTPAAEKAAAGAFSWLDVALVPNLVRALGHLATRGLWSVGLDGEAPSTVWETSLLDGPVALVVGAEGRGLSRLVADRCDALAAIPLPGHVGSLNASAAAAVALFEILRRRTTGS